jgi:hypothetical protein
VAKKAATQQRSGQGKGPKEGGETVSGYFRRVFKENPRLLKERSNDELFRRWLADHPGSSTVPDKVKTSLQSVKNVLRARLKARKAERQARAGAGPGPHTTAQEAAARRLGGGRAGDRRLPRHGLAIDREGLREVIALLRQARNVVVRRAGG